MSLTHVQRRLRTALWHLRDGFNRERLAYRGPADFVLRHGTWFRPFPWLPGWPRGLPLHCYANTIVNAVQRGWRYVEGYALEPVQGTAIHHSWNLDQDGTIVDGTWLNAGLAYIGVQFSPGRADNCTWGGDATVLDDFNRGWPLLQEAWTGETEWQGEPSPALQLLLDAQALVPK